MTILTTIYNQKTHIIWGLVVVAIASVAYHFFKKDPVTLTKTQVQTVEKVVSKDRIVYVDRTTTTHKKNGDVIVTVEHVNDSTKLDSKTNSQLSQKIVESFMKNYSISVMFPVLNNSLNVNSNPVDTRFMLGVRVFSSPIFLEAGSNVRLNELTLGLRLEF